MRQRASSDLARLGRRLKILRIERGLTLREVAERAGVGKEYVYKVEVAKRKPSARLLDTLARVFALDKHELYGECGRIPDKTRHVYLTRPYLVGRLLDIAGQLDDKALRQLVVRLARLPGVKGVDVG